MRRVPDMAVGPDSEHAQSPNKRLEAPDVLISKMKENSFLGDLCRAQGAHIKRRVGFQYIVRRYLSQLMHGCTNPYCTTPMCKSCQKRVKNVPFRAPTPLVARILAFYLATQDDPLAALCPHPLRVPPSEIGYVKGSFSSAPEGQESIAKSGSSPDGTTDNGGKSVDGTLHHLESIREAARGQRAQQKDQVSLSQNLFDTTTIIASYYESNCDGVENTAHFNTPQMSVAQRQVKQISATKLSYDKPEQSQNVEIDPRRPKPTDDSCLCDEQANSTTDASLGSPFETIDSASITEEFQGNGGMSGTPSSPIEHTGKLHDRLTSTTCRPSQALGDQLSCSILTRLKGLAEADSLKNWRSLDEISWVTIRSCDETTNAAVSSPSDLFLHFVLSNPSRLLRSFRDDMWSDHNDSKLPHLPPIELEHAFRGWSEVNGPLIFDSLWQSLESLFWPLPKSHSEGGDDHEDRHLNDAEAAHIVMLCVHALTSHVPRALTSVWPLLRRQSETNFMSTKQVRGLPKRCKKSLLQLYDAFHYEPALRLAERLFRAIATRRNHHERRQFTRSSGNKRLGSVPFGLMQIVCQHLAAVEIQATQQRKARGVDPELEKDTGWTVTSCFLEWLRTVFLISWDKKATVERWSAAGAAIEIIGDFASFVPSYSSLTDALRCRKPTANAFGIRLELMHMNYLHCNLDIMKVGLGFLDSQPDTKTAHILEYPFLFPIRERVSIFRAVNWSKMKVIHNDAERTRCIQGLMDYCFYRLFTPPWQDVLTQRGQRCLVLDVRRGHVLQDAYDQLWDLDREQLQKPLKVKIGALEGEQGLDHGGVSFEFFRIALAEAFKPDYGIFHIDPHSNMAWFKPMSPAPTQQYRFLGILFSLALYNGITIPVTFPIIFYHRLLDENVMQPLSTYQDGWPQLVRSFEQVLEWESGDASEIYGGDYEYTFDAYDERHTINMVHPYSEPPLDLAPLVTNANRGRFVSDYMTWLTYGAVAEQFLAFKMGFMACFDPDIFSLFSATELRTLVEGHQEIKLDDLKRIVTYDNGYTVDHPTITQFWNIVGSYDDAMLRRLLEFVTASDRIPMGGEASMKFSIERNGVDTEMLPTSSTCFAILLLPEYESEEKLRRKLAIALENAQGFGND